MGCEENVSKRDEDNNHQQVLKVVKSYGSLIHDVLVFSDNLMARYKNILSTIVPLLEYIDPDEILVMVLPGIPSSMVIAYIMRHAGLSGRIVYHVVPEWFRIMNIYFGYPVEKKALLMLEPQVNAVYANFVNLYSSELDIDGDVMYMSIPNNPSGALVNFKNSSIVSVVERLEKTDGLLIIDVAHLCYLCLEDEEKSKYLKDFSEFISKYTNFIVVGSLSKIISPRLRTSIVMLPRGYIHKLVNLALSTMQLEMIGFNIIIANLIKRLFDKYSGSGILGNRIERVCKSKDEIRKLYGDRIYYSYGGSYVCMDNNVIRDIRRYDRRRVLRLISGQAFIPDNIDSYLNIPVRGRLEKWRNTVRLSLSDERVKVWLVQASPVQKEENV